MLAVKGYFDGSSILPSEQISIKPYQRVIITVLDEYITPPKPAQRKGMRGALSQYANPILAEQEQEAWERSAMEKHGHS